MGQYRKKPVVIEALQLQDVPGVEGRRAVPNWSEAESTFPGIHPVGNRVGDAFECLGFNIVTLEGTMFAGPGDWIIRGVKGELYPCRADIFEATYEPA